MSRKTKKQGTSRIVKILGPGLITGAADNDPSGIATYSQAGAQFGYGQLWLTVFLYPLMTAVQEASARIGAVTRKGIAAVTKENYPPAVLYSMVALIFVANTLNIGADIGAMAASLELIAPIPFTIGTLIFVAMMLLFEIFIPYKNYVRILKWLLVVMLVYPLTMFLVEEPWMEILQATFIPHLELTPEFLFIVTAVIGTTISPYMFFWEASEEIEEEIKNGEIENQIVSKGFIKNMRIDTALGMFFSQFVTWSIIITAATVLHTNGVTDITSAADAAHALEPLVQTFPGAGYWARFIFATGVIGLGLIAVPILSGSAAYTIAEAFHWDEGLYKKLREAHGFYGVISIATLFGLGINFIGINPIHALIVTAVLNALVSIPLIFLIIRISSSRKIMGEYASGLLSKTFLWLTFAVVLLSSLITLVMIFR
ncbi:MAG: divalent metal cation transporter [Patescibacteria group bacterium]